MLGVWAIAEHKNIMVMDMDMDMGIGEGTLRSSINCTAIITQLLEII
jgi:predicted nuclease of predicted toxin-antitoxin system